MSQVQDLLYNEISQLPIEKMGKVLSFVRYLKQEAEEELWLDPSEEDELHELRTSGDFVDASDVLV